MVILFRVRWVKKVTLRVYMGFDTGVDKSGTDQAVDFGIGSSFFCQRPQKTCFTCILPIDFCQLVIITVLPEGITVSAGRRSSCPEWAASKMPAVFRACRMQAGISGVPPGSDRSQYTHLSLLPVQTRAYMPRHFPAVRQMAVYQKVPASHWNHQPLLQGEEGIPPAVCVIKYRTARPADPFDCRHIIRQRNPFSVQVISGFLHPKANFKGQRSLSGIPDTDSGTCAGFHLFQNGTFYLFKRQDVSFVRILPPSNCHSVLSAER